MVPSLNFVDGLEKADKSPSIEEDESAVVSFLLSLFDLMVAVATTWEGCKVVVFVFLVAVAAGMTTLPSALTN